MRKAGGGSLPGVSLSMSEGWRRRRRAPLSGKARSDWATIREMTPPDWGRSISSCIRGTRYYLFQMDVALPAFAAPEAGQGLERASTPMSRRRIAVIIRRQQRYWLRLSWARGRER